MRRRDFIVAGTAAGAYASAQAAGMGLDLLSGLPRLNPVGLGASPANDATSFIQQCHDLCAAQGGGRIIIDRPLVCSSVFDRGGVWNTLEFWGDNITLEFTGNGSLLFPASGLENYRPVIVGGMAKLGGRGRSIRTQRCVDAPVIDLSRELERGSRVIRFSSAGSFRAGDLVYIRSGQLLAGLTTEPDAELASVRQVRRDSILLEGPLSKSYRREFLQADGRSSPAALGKPAPFGIVNVTDRITRNFRLINPVMRSDNALQLLSIWSVWGFESSGGMLTFGNLGVGSRDSRFVHWTTPLYHTGAVAGSYALAPSTGCSNWDVVWNVRSPNFTYLHIHEGVAQSRFRGSIRLGGSGGKGPALSIARRAYDIEIGDIDIDTGTSDQAAIIVTDDVTGGVRFNRIRINNNSRRGSAIRVDTERNVRFLERPVYTGTNRILKFHRPKV